VIIETAAGPVELDESGIPPELLPRVRARFKGQTETLSRAHGAHWPVTREWTLDYLREELRERVESGEVWHVL
jgi:hypothetical protein